MTKRDYKKEAQLLILDILRERAILYGLIDDATKEYFEQNSPNNTLKLEPARQFPPLQKLMRGSGRLEQLFGKSLYILVVEACYNTEDNLALPESQWTDHTRQIYNSLVKKIAKLIKHNKIKPLI